jgi:enoyl-CoA hydratase/carnithine racemase
MENPALRFETIPGREGRGLGIATLDAPDRINALDLSMVEGLFDTLCAWRDDPGIACIVLLGAGGKGFCAGGDLMKLFESMEESPTPGGGYAAAFFEREYRLDHMLHTFEKPVVCWGSGIVMGGGVGLLSASGHGIVTETSRVAMPEITIGLFPDVGGTRILGRMPHGTGLFMGLTGCVINGSDALYTGMANHFIAHDLREAVIEALRRAPWGDDPARNDALAGELLEGFAARSRPLRPSPRIEPNAALIRKLTGGEDLGEIARRITTLETDDPWLKKCGANLAGGCPTTAHIVHRQVGMAGSLSLAEIFRLEMIIAIQCTLHPDFAEGIRALLIRKDRSPAWHHCGVDEVPKEWIDEHFTPPWEGENPLADL